MRNEKTFFAANVIIPLVIGAAVYYIMSPDVIFVRGVDGLLGLGVHVGVHDNNFMLIKFIRNYFLDMLWAYALVFALQYIIGNKTAKSHTTLFVAFIFTAVIEMLQLTSLASGTFDVLDILVELIAEVIAVIIIILHNNRRMKYEKGN